MIIADETNQLVKPVFFKILYFALYASDIFMIALSSALVVDVVVHRYIFKIKVFSKNSVSMYFADFLASFVYLFVSTTAISYALGELIGKNYRLSYLYNLIFEYSNSVFGMVYSYLIILMIHYYLMRKHFDCKLYALMIKYLFLTIGAIGLIYGYDYVYNTWIHPQYY